MTKEKYTGVCAIQDKCNDYADFVESIMEEVDNDDDIPCPIKCEHRVNPRHINPGTDTTINPVVIDDSYRERKPEYDPIFIGLINYFKEIQWQRVESDISVTEIIEILTDFAKMEAEEKASHTNAPSQPKDRLCDDCNIIEIENKLIDTERQLIMAQQRIIDAIGETRDDLILEFDCGYESNEHDIEVINKHFDALIALLQAGDHHE